MKKLIILLVVFLFVGMGFNSISGNQINNQIIKYSRWGNILYVGGNGEGNYSSIQDAIDNASDGDTVFVYNGIYYESIQINKSINLIGEDRNTTTIDDNSSEHIIYIAADNVSIREFTIQNSKKYGISIQWSNLGTISDNIIIDNLIGMWMHASDNNIIKDNTFFDNKDWTLDLSFCDYNTISGNTFSHTIATYTGWGIGLVSSKWNNISGNLIKNNDEGFILYEAHSNLISYNNITQNTDCGIEIKFSSNNRIIGNNISYNSYDSWPYYGGISIQENPSNNNIIYQNNFINNFVNAMDVGNNIWDDGKYGNYWSDYEERYPNAKPKLFEPWMWNTPYEIEGGDNQDNCPLIKQWPNSVSIDIPRDKATSNMLLLRIIERFPLLQKLLQQLSF